MTDKYPSKWHRPFWESKPIDIDAVNKKILKNPIVRPLYVTTKVNIEKKMIDEIFKKIDYEYVIKEENFRYRFWEEHKDKLIRGSGDVPYITYVVLETVKDLIKFELLTKIEKLTEERELNRLKAFKKQYKCIISQKEFEEKGVNSK